MADRRDKDEDEIPELEGYVPGDMEDEIPELGEYQEEPERSWLDHASDLLTGAVEGAGSMFGGLRNINPVLASRGPTARVFEEHDKNLAEAGPAAPVGEALGRAGSAVALGGMAGPKLAAQTAAGAVSGAANAADESNGDPLAMLAGGGSGALFGLGGGLIGKGADALSGMSSAVLEQLKPATIRQWVDRPLRSLMTAGLRGVASRPDVMRGIATTARGAGQAAAAGGGEITGLVSKAGAQDVAYGGAPTMAWAVQSVLTRGSGLPPADDQRLREAVLSGDMDKLVDAQFALSQKFPGFAARMRSELEGLREED